MTLPNSFFGSFNPYSDLIRGDWFNPKGREHHTGAVYLNGDWLTEAAKLDDVLKPAGADAALVRPGGQGQHHDLGAVQGGRTPTSRLVEINVRRDGLLSGEAGHQLHHRARLHPAPRGHALGAAHRRADRPDRHALEQGLDHREQRDQPLDLLGHRARASTATSGTTPRPTPPRATSRPSSAPWPDGWNKETIGHHIVRNNTISHCEQAGIVGSLGAVFSTVTGNTIHDIHVRQLFTGAEMAGIKFHAAIDVEISRNHIYRTCRGLWLDWMAQGTRVTRQPVPRQPGRGPVRRGGPRAVPGGQQPLPFADDPADMSQGGAYVHNLMAGALRIVPFDARQTPFHKAHSTELAGMHDNPCGDDRFYNNLFVGPGDLSVYDKAQLPVWMDGNVFLKGAKPSKHESEAARRAGIRSGAQAGRKGRRLLPRARVGQDVRGPRSPDRDHRAARQGGHPGSSLRAARRHAHRIEHRLFRQEEERVEPDARAVRGSRDRTAQAEGPVAGLPVPPRTTWRW